MGGLTKIDGIIALESSSHPSVSEIQEILKDYGMAKLTSAAVLHGGHENTNFLIHASNDNYVLGIFEQKSDTEVNALGRLLDHLNINGFITPRIIQTKDGKYSTLWKGKPVVLKEYIEGNVVDILSPHQLNLIGLQMGQLHQVKPMPSLKKQVNYGLQDFNKNKCANENRAFSQWLNTISDYISTYYHLDLPKSIIHGDVFWNNVIIDVNASRATIIDFEEACYYPRIFDIGMAIIGCCSDNGEVDFSRAMHLLQGYQSINSLHKNEVESLLAFTIYAGSVMTFWRYVHYNHINPDSEKSTYYLELKSIVDFLLKQEVNCLARYIES